MNQLRKPTEIARGAQDSSVYSSYSLITGMFQHSYAFVRQLYILHFKMRTFRRNRNFRSRIILLSGSKLNSFDMAPVQSRMCPSESGVLSHVLRG